MRDGVQASSPRAPPPVREQRQTHCQGPGAARRLSFTGFLKTAQDGDVIGFAPELLGPSNCYARTTTNGTERSDRWRDALLLARLAQEEFELASRHCL
jgi:hypothetical protein